MSLSLLSRAWDTGARRPSWGGSAERNRTKEVELQIAFRKIQGRRLWTSGICSQRRGIRNTNHIAETMQTRLMPACASSIVGGVAMLRVTQFIRVIGANARSQGIVFVWPRLGCKLLGQK